MFIKSFLFILLVGCIACKSKKSDDKEQQLPFDKEKWQVMNEQDYAYRDQMLHDLVYNVPLKGKPKDSIINMLGEPNRTDSGYLYYTISVQKMGLMVLHAKTLVLKLDKDSTVEWRKIHG